MRNRRKKGHEEAVELTEERYLQMMARLVQLCPSSLTVAVIAHCDRGPGPMILGSCCRNCSLAAIHMAAEVVDDPRPEVAVPGVGEAIH